MFTDRMVLRRKLNKGGCMMIKWFAIPTVLMAGVAAVWVTNAPAQEPSVVLICRGELRTIRTDGGKVIKTPFKWAKEAAGKENPGAGECAWADRAPQGNEKPGDPSTIIGNMGPFDNIPVGTIGKICVTKASGDGKDLMVKQIVRQLGHQTAPFHIPPFSAD